MGEQEEQGMGVKGEDGRRNWEEREKGRRWVNKKEQGENVKFSQYYSWPTSFTMLLEWGELSMEYSCTPAALASRSGRRQPSLIHTAVDLPAKTCR